MLTLNIILSGNYLVVSDIHLRVPWPSTAGQSKPDQTPAQQLQPVSSKYSLEVLTP